MSDPNPRADLPFPEDVISYCARRLLALGIEPDREWLRGYEPNIVDVLCGSDQGTMAAEARNHVPRSIAIWETSDFYRWAIPLAVYDLSNGPLTKFEHFELLYVQMLGEVAKPWLPSLYLAALASPGIDADYRVKLLLGFNEQRLRFEQEADDRASRLNDDD